MARNVSRTILDNGVRVVTKHMPHVHSVSMGVWVNVGARDEKPAESGLSHLIEHMIFKGTQRRSAYQIAKEFDAIGGYTNAFTSLESTCYHAKVMDTHLTAMVDILSDIFLNSLFDQVEIDRERPVILQEISMLEDNPEDFLHALAGEHFWGDHPLGRSILGSPDNLRRFDAQSVRRFFRHYYQPERIVIAAAGNLSHQQIVDLTAEAFGSVHPGPPIPGRTTPRGQAGLRRHERKLEQLHLCLNLPGIAVADDRRYACSLLNTILGGNMSSRLFQEIRERRGLAYAVYSFVSSYEDTGLFGVFAGVAPQNGAETVDCILAQLRRLKTEPVPPARMRDAKEYTKGNLLLAAESNDNQMVRLAQNEIYFGEFTSLEEIAVRIDAVTAEDILVLAADLFHADQLALTQLGPAGTAAVVAHGDLTL